MRTSRIVLLPTLLLLPVLAGCPAQSDGNASGGGSASATSGHIKIKGEDGKAAFELKLKGDGAKVVDASEKELFRLKAKSNKVKLKDAADTVLGYVKFYGGEGDYFKVKNANQDKDLFKFQPQADGDWKLEDSSGALICKVKKRDYGWTIRDKDDKDLFKVKVKDGKTSLRNAADTTVYYTKAKVSSLAFAALGLDALNDGQKMALLYQVNASGK